MVDNLQPRLTGQAAEVAPTSASETLAFLALASIRGVGYWTLARMAKAGLGFAAFLQIEDTEEASSGLRRFGARLDAKAEAEWPEVRNRALDRATRTLQSLDSTGTRIIMAGDSDFPRSLLDLDDCPAWLFVQGDASVINKPSVAAVGTRNPSGDGAWLGRFVGLCFEGWQSPTVSGLAAGVDGIVHEMSLRAKVPTIAVLGTGIFSEYPKGSTTLRDRILASAGAVVTEYLPNESYSAENFVRRNRIQAALARVLIPIEWASRSGTAHTVRYASSLKRPIAGLRLPDWPKDRVAFSNGAGETTVTFTIPGQEQDFRQFVANCLRSAKPPQPAQLSLI